MGAGQIVDREESFLQKRHARSRGRRLSSSIVLIITTEIGSAFRIGGVCMCLPSLIFVLFLFSLLRSLSCSVTSNLSCSVLETDAYLSVGRDRGVSSQRSLCSSSIGTDKNAIATTVVCNRRRGRGPERHRRGRFLRETGGNDPWRFRDYSP